MVPLILGNPQISRSGSKSRPGAPCFTLAVETARHEKKEGTGCRVWSLGLRVYGLVFRVYGLGSKV